MPSPKSSTKPKKPKSPLIFRRVVGGSMSPKLKPGQVVIASPWFRVIKPGEVYIFNHAGREMIKRVERIKDSKAFFVGDNLENSTDSRHFGWIEIDHIRAKVVRPKVHN